jgi:TolA-binding protein
VVKEYPQSPQAPDSLWLIAFYSKALGQKPQAVDALHQLQREYPHNRRIRFVPRQLQELSR